MNHLKRLLTLLALLIIQVAVSAQGLAQNRCEFVFGESAPKPVAPNTQPPEQRALAAFRSSHDALTASSDSIGVIDRIFQDSAANIEAITHLISSEKMPAEAEPRLLAPKSAQPSGAILSQVTKRTKATLAKAEKEIRKSRTYWGRLLLRLRHPLLGLEAVGQNVRRDQHTLSSAIKTVEAENENLKALQAEVTQANLLVEQELTYLRTLSELFLKEAKTLDERAPLRIALETEVVPAVQTYLPHVMELAALVSANRHRLNTYLQTNNRALIDANATKLGALPVFMAKNAVELGLTGNHKPERRQSSYDTVDEFAQFCVSGGLCSGTRVLTFEEFTGEGFYSIRWTYGRVHSVLPNGTFAVETEGYTSQNIVRKIQEIAITDSSIDVMGFSVGRTVAHKTKNLLGVIVGIRMDGAAIVQTQIGRETLKVVPLAELVVQ